ncbi:type II toxin-antitoxin system RelE/ParE family toxin [Thalassomonas viridans]|uniref:Toxin n=1 Tax=Thalassomonas viridans TaxID=137584 RepID=A0AAE9Z246_9GAMM|nr:type II toxin-antitoxin system RelE/ParE family toxin [Thalassomonas viridans]WDE03833.1 type II toxin-antitoxin system RelE/ParE family toxin [Thalassomonas viridans]
MKAFVLTNAAKADLKRLALYTQKEWGKEQRNLYLKQFDDAFYMLADTPSVGKACDNIKAGYKKFPIGSHIVFYKKGADAYIEVIRILHKRMDAEVNLQGL